MRTFIGIDLGSTTTKAVLLDENQDVIGRGITNSRSNYGTAARVASEEARVDGRFTSFVAHCMLPTRATSAHRNFWGRWSAISDLVQFLEQLDDLEETCLGQLKSDRFASVAGAMREAIGEVFKRLRIEGAGTLRAGANRKSDFFRDIAGSRFHVYARRSPGGERPA